MALKRITIQDIADACGLSRNTVSKVFNNRGNVPEATRHAVLQKAQELGYYALPENALSKEELSSGRNIALLTGSQPLNHHFGSFFITGFTDQICRAGFNLKMFEISPDEMEKLALPPHFLPKDTAGILGIELFDKDYSDMLNTLGIPTVYVDSYAHSIYSVLDSDLISMENIASATAMTQHMIKAGAKTLGFVGDITHCMSFEERWFGYYNALKEVGIKPNREFCILERDDAAYGDPDWILQQLDRMPGIPDGFVCANDYLAISLMAALKKKGLSIPDDVMVTGFDGSPESAVVEPALTTAYIPSTDIGRMTADVLLDRIENPDRPFRRTYVKTTPIFRGSTR